MKYMYILSCHHPLLQTQPMLLVNKLNHYATCIGVVCQILAWEFWADGLWMHTNFMWKLVRPFRLYFWQKPLRSKFPASNWKSKVALRLFGADSVTKHYCMWNICIHHEIINDLFFHCRISGLYSTDLFNNHQDERHYEDAFHRSF